MAKRKKATLAQNLKRFVSSTWITDFQNWIIY